MTDPVLAITIDSPSGLPGAGYLTVGGNVGLNVAPDVLYVDHATDARDINIQFGSSSPTDFLFEPEPGTCDVTFDNRARTFDPDVNSDIRPGRAIQLTDTYSATTYNLFTGTVDQWAQDWPAFGYDARTVAHATDGLSQLAQLSIPTDTVFESNYPGARIDEILNLVGWPPSLRNLATGATLMEESGATSSALDAIFLAVRSELGQAYVDTDGTFVFRSRAAISTDSRSITSQATFSDTGSLKYQSIETMPTDKSDIVNTVTVIYNQAGDFVTAQDNASITTYGPRSLSQPVTISSTDPNVAASYAGFIVTLYSQRHLRFGSITIRPAHTPSSLWAQAFGRKIGDRITVVRTPPAAGGALSELCFIVGIQHQTTASTSQRDWSTKYLLMDATNWPTSPFGW